MIYFNGRSSDDFRLFVEKYPARPVPQRKTERFKVLGRSGDALDIQDAWENVQREYEVYLSAEREGLPRIARAAMEWLMAPGYHELWDEYDADTFVMATYLGNVSVQNIDNAFGRFKLTFDCWPQRFLANGAKPVTLTQAGSLVNPTIYPAEPLIVVQGSGAGVLTVNGAALTLTDCNGVTLDSRDEDAWRGTTSMNASVSGSYPKLTAGSNAVSWTGGITSVTITPRWYTI